MTELSIEQVEKISWLVKTCGQQAVTLSAQSFDVFEKGVEDYATSVDRLLDRQLADGLAGLFPHDGIITEENAGSRQIFQSGYSRQWLVDPLDGTDDFIQGKPHYAVMVGLLAEDQPQAGWVYAPVFDRLYFGGAKLGLFQTHGTTTESFTPIEPAAPTADFCPLIIGDKDRKRYGEAIAQFIPGVRYRSIGSFGLKVMEVISGQAGLYVYLNGRVKLWDTTAPLALAATAGLVCCDLDGEPLRFTPDAMHLDTLAHRQPIIVGWASYVEELRPTLRRAIHSI